ncbi:MAG: DUF4416 family protein [Anaerolineae bacterium]|jgi:hypothetical protein
MGTARTHQPVKLMASLLTGDLSLLAPIKEALVGAFGAIDFASEMLPFDHTDYYEAEFGPGLARQIVTFRRLVPPEALPAIKRQTNEMEWAFAGEAGRRVNVDPGYVSLNKLVLATTKNHAHRLYLGEGIYGEVTLAYRQGRFRPWPWSYPDYASEAYCALFGRIRLDYKAQLRQGDRSTGPA